MIYRIAKPKEVSIVGDENGNIVREDTAKQILKKLSGHLEG